MSEKGLNVIFKGLVQGVGFRFTVRSLAQRYRIKGWVRNLTDGQVEALLLGDEDSFGAFFADLKETFRGNITDIKKKNIEIDSSFEGFFIEV